MNIYIYIYTYIHILYILYIISYYYIYIYIHIHVYIYIYIYLWRHIYIYIHIHTHMFAFYSKVAELGVSSQRVSAIAPFSLCEKPTREASIRALNQRRVPLASIRAKRRSQTPERSPSSKPKPPAARAPALATVLAPTNATTTTIFPAAGISTYDSSIQFSILATCYHLPACLQAAKGASRLRRGAGGQRS